MIKLFMFMLISVTLVVFLGHENRDKLFTTNCKSSFKVQTAAPSKKLKKIDTFNVDSITSRVYALVFYGRKRQVSIMLRYLLPNLKVNGGVLEKIIFCIKTNKTADLAYLDEIMQANHLHFEKFHAKTGSYAEFYQLVKDDDLVFKIDDDIVFIQNGTFERMLEEYIKKDPLFLSANVINHTILSHIHARLQAILWFYEESQYNWVLNKTAQTMNPICMHLAYVAWSAWWFKPQLAAIAHESFLHHIYNNNLDVYNFGRWDFHTQNFTRWSINFFLFRGKYLNNMTHYDDEKEISEIIPATLNRHPYALGSALVAHFSYYKQYSYLINTTILDKYEQLVEDYFSIL